MSRRPRIALALAVSALALLGGCSSPRLDAAGARQFTRAALADAGLRSVKVADGTEPCRVEGSVGVRTTADTSIGEISMCVSRSQGRALSVRDPGMTETQFDRLDRYRSDTSSDRARPIAAVAAGLMLVGVLIDLLLSRRPPPPR